MFVSFDSSAFGFRDGTKKLRKNYKKSVFRIISSNIILNALCMSEVDKIDLQLGDQTGAPRVFELRGYLVMLATNVAEILKLANRN
jgi:hypothetical protein